MASRFGVGGSTYHHGTRVQEVDHLAFGAYPVEVLRRAGGWDERLRANEDFELDHRLRSAGLRLLFEPRMVIRWECRQSIGDLWRQYRRYGRGKVDVLRLHPGSVHPRHLAPPLLVAGLAQGVMSATRGSLPYRALVAGYLGVVAAGSVANAGRLDSARERLRLPAAFVAMHLAWGVGFWNGIAATALERVSGRRSST
jgi:succinoglycan biosynthesis protein ExoA